jgi:hypothetical protein
MLELHEILTLFIIAGVSYLTLVGVKATVRAENAERALTNIAAATRNIKHGTARRVHRMAVQALEGDGE